MLKVKHTRDREDGIANRFGFQTSRREPPQQTGCRIDTQRRRVRLVALSPCIRIQNQPMNVLQRPSVISKFSSQPIEQFGMSCRAPLSPKSLGVSTMPVPK